jgi:hypothetical protein
MYGLPQAGKLANNRLIQFLAPHLNPAPSLLDSGAIPPAT